MMDCYSRTRTQRLGDRRAQLEAVESRRRECSIVGLTPQSTSASKLSPRVSKSGPVKSVRFHEVVLWWNVPT